MSSLRKNIEVLPPRRPAGRQSRSVTQQLGEVSFRILLSQNGSDQGYVPWDLRTKDNLDVAPGLYVFQVSAQGVGEYVGKFAIIK